jgi:hypothetical protein
MQALKINEPHGYFLDPVFLTISTIVIQFTQPRLSYIRKMPLQHFITAGNSGIDADMLTGKTRAIVVANYNDELEELRKNKSIYFTKQPTAAGVLEGIHFYTGSIDFHAHP